MGCSVNAQRLGGHAGRSCHPGPGPQGPSTGLASGPRPWRRRGCQRHAPSQDGIGRRRLAANLNSRRKPARTAVRSIRAGHWHHAQAAPSGPGHSVETRARPRLSKPPTRRLPEAIAAASFKFVNLQVSRRKSRISGPSTSRRTGTQTIAGGGPSGRTGTGLNLLIGR